MSVVKSAMYRSHKVRMLTPGGALLNAIRSVIHWMSGYASKVKLHNDRETLVSLAVVSGITDDMNLILISGRGREVY